MKIGAYITANNNPSFLRHAFLQILAQTLKPHVVVIHQNNHTPEYSWVIADLLKQAENLGIKVVQIYNESVPVAIDWYIVPIQALIVEGCEYFVRFEQDDIYFDFHVEKAVAQLKQGYDFVVTRKVGLLRLPKKSPYSYDSLVDFGPIHAPGGMSGSIVFTRAFAVQNIADLIASRHENTWEDQITTKKTMLKFEGRICIIEDNHPSCCYVAHGANASVAHWVPDEA